jgi:hypothetical protein
MMYYVSANSLQVEGYPDEDIFVFGEGVNKLCLFFG